MAESNSQPDIDAPSVANLEVQLREQSVLSSNDIVYGNQGLVETFLQSISQKISGPNTGVILESFEQHISVWLKDGKLYSEGSHYDISKYPLGKGFFGTVNLCIDKTSGMSFVSKRVKLLEDSKHYKSLDREVRALLCLDDVHVIKFYGIIHREKFVVDILLEPWGESLKIYLSTRSPTPYDVYLWFYQLLYAVIYIHGKDLVHCDIHFGNILIEANLIKLCDFGSAKKIGEKLFTRSHGNTPIYFPPTVLRHFLQKIQIQVSPRIDTYAVGKLLLEVVTCRSNSPINDMNEEIISDKTKWNDFVKSKIHRNTPEDIQKVITGLMSFTSNDGINANDAKGILRAKLHCRQALQ